MADLEITVRYKSRLAKAGLIGVVACMPIWGILAPLFLFIGLFSAVISEFTRREIFAHPLSYVGPWLGLLLLIALGVKAVLNLADNRIVVSKLGIEFPFFLANTYGLRRKFSWAAIHKARLHIGPDRRELVLYTTDGFPVYLNVACMAPNELEQLLVGLDVWATHCEKDHELELLQDELQKGSDQKLLPSYTSMWDDELSRRFSSTAYVPLEPGHHLQNGRLKILSQVSFGGLSAVYLCQKNEQELVVLKEAVVPGDGGGEIKSKALELFEREAHILMKLDHPKIMKVLDHFVDSERHYLLLEYHNGQDLKQFVKHNGPPSEEKVCSWALEIASILEYLHDQEPPIIHRDLTPDNLVLGIDGAIVMIDFGAANEFVGKATGTLVGKQSFIAPEQFRGKATAQSDLYALGCTLHFLLTGAEPVPLSVSHPRKINPAVSPKMDALVASLTAMNVEDRVSSATQLKALIVPETAVPIS
jgi:hypothetical protein